jgi:hypothetical protein
MRLDVPGDNLRTLLLLLIALLGAFTLCPLSAQAQAAGKGLSKQDVIDLLTGDVPAERVAAIAKQRGVAFAMTAAAEKDIRAAGGSDDLIKALRALAPHAPAAPKAPPRTTSTKSPPTVLMIQSTPGESQVYVDDEPMGSTSREGRLRLTHVAPGGHNVRISLGGYQDHEQDVTVTEGETTTVIATLQPPSAPPPASHPQVAQPPVVTPVQPPPSVNPPSLSNMPHNGFVTFTVAHDHGKSGKDYCVGVMSIGNGMIYYRANNGVHNFEIPLTSVREARRNAVYLAAIGAFHIRQGKGTNYNFVVLNQQNQYLSPDPLLMAIDRAMGK